MQSRWRAVFGFGGRDGDGGHSPPYAGAAQRRLALAAGFLAWMFAGLEISSFVMVTRQAVISMADLGDAPSIAEREAVEQDAKGWLLWYQATFLLGGAAGGWLFGWLGDRAGRAKALAWSVLTYSLTMGAGYFAVSLEQLLVVRFVSCLGVGGTWPNAVALVAESWPAVSRPFLAGLLGTAANFGFVLLGILAGYRFVTPDDWRWVMAVGAAPVILGVLTLLFVREPAQWLAGRASGVVRANTIREVFRPPFRARTYVGIVLGAVPVVGTAVNAVWVTPWSDQVATQAGEGAKKAPEAKTPAAEADRDSWLPHFDDPRAKGALAQVTRSSGAALGSLLGGWLAALAGRRLAYFLISMATLGVSVALYGFQDPTSPYFSWFVFALGFAGVTYFGWLPLYLPELFPTRIRATGSGVTFNSGRAVAAVAAIAVAAALASSRDVNYALIGLWTSGIYLVGMMAILFAPDTSKRGLEDE